MRSRVSTPHEERHMTLEAEPWHETEQAVLGNKNHVQRFRKILLESKRNTIFGIVPLESFRKKQDV